jgi:serine/threonine protein kinase
LLVANWQVPDNALFWQFFGDTLKFSPELKHLVNGLIDEFPKKRFNIDEVLAHPWLKGPMATYDEVCIEGKFPVYLFI